MCLTEFLSAPVAKETWANSSQIIPWTASASQASTWYQEWEQRLKTQDNTVVLIAGREKNKIQDIASARIECISFRSNQGFSISLYFSSNGGTRYFWQMEERIGLLFQLLSWWCYKSSVFWKAAY